ncbi:MAG TPA: hypothetical protein VLE22_16530 [Bryobacteraceae bacterium]|nr:hypothetical protein [Bryobacteraceae bacterium]
MKWREIKRLVIDRLPHQARLFWMQFGIDKTLGRKRFPRPGRWLGLHDIASGAVSLADKGGTVVLWSSEAGDRSIWWGALKRGGPRKVADRLVHNLKDAMGM